MGIVYRTRDCETDEMVALKVLQPEIARDEDVIARFKSELSLARKITHKNVCRTYDLHRFGATTAIAMEYIEGETLRGLLNRSENLSVRNGLKILRQVIAGLGEAHAQKIIHRDLKPENIFIARDGTVKVMDFGIARSLEARTSKTGTIIGTPAYMSPEQAEGKAPDARSDIYALGLVMYEMFTGQLAFKAETPVALAIKQIMERPTPPRELEPTLPPSVEAAISRCLEKDPAKRFQSVAELEAALLEGTPEQPSAVGGVPPPRIQAPSPSAPGKTVPTQRAKVLQLAALAALASLIIVAFFAGRHFWPTRPSLPTPQVPSAQTEPSEPVLREPVPRQEVHTSRSPASPGRPTYSPQPAVYHSTGQITQGWWNGAGGTACCGCGIKHYGVLPASFEPGYLRAVTFYLRGSRRNSYYSTIRQGSTTLRFILGDRQVLAESREALAGETGALDLPWVIKFEFDSPVYAKPGMRWELLDGDGNIYSAVLLHQSNIPSRHNTQFALEGTSDQNGCQYTFKRTVWYSAKFEYQ
jgi:serine/threonine protein kinase